MSAEVYTPCYNAVDKKAKSTISVGLHVIPHSTQIRPKQMLRSLDDFGNY
jgi:hypothetical protein